MKITIVFLFVLIGSAVAQNIGGSQQAPIANSFEISSHPMEAHYAPLNVNRDLLLPNSIIVMEGGTHPTMGEWVKQPAPEPLGTVARRNRIHTIEFTNGKVVSTVTP